MAINKDLQHKDQIFIHKAQYYALWNISFWLFNVYRGYALQQFSHN